MSLGVCVVAIWGRGAGRVDHGVHRWWLDHRSPALTHLFRAITQLGEVRGLVGTVLVLGLGLAVWQRTARPVVALLVGLAVANVVSTELKAAIGRPRPSMRFWLDHPSGAAFPSGHSIQVATVWLLMALLLSDGRSPGLRRGAMAVAGTVALAVMASRLYLGVHWLTDVVGGAAMGVIIATALHGASKRLGSARVTAT
jgi:undecaprenyl-diphosphatase